MKTKTVLDNATYSIKKNSTPRVKLNGVKLYTNNSVSRKDKSIQHELLKRRIKKDV